MNRFSFLIISLIVFVIGLFLLFNSVAWGKQRQIPTLDRRAEAWMERSL